MEGRIVSKVEELEPGAHHAILWQESFERVDYGQTSQAPYLKIEVFTSEAAWHKAVDEASQRNLTQHGKVKFIATVLYVGKVRSETKIDIEFPPHGGA